MPNRTYLANGIVGTSRQVGCLAGMSEFRIRNLADSPNTVRQRVFFSDREPFQLEPLSLEPMAGPYQEFPLNLPSELKEAGPWGMEIDSDAPVAFLHIGLGGRNGERSDHGFGGGCAMVLATPILAKQWTFPDSFRMFVDRENPAFPFSQYEWYHVLNPHAGAVTVQLELGDDEGLRMTRTYEIAPERVLFIDDPDLHPRLCCWARFRADAPVLVQAERVIHSPAGPQDWGVVIGCNSPGVPE
jgi:hypothetical protein